MRKKAHERRTCARTVADGVRGACRLGAWRLQAGVSRVEGGAARHSRCAGQVCPHPQREEQQGPREEERDAERLGEALLHACLLARQKGRLVASCLAVRGRAASALAGGGRLGGGACREATDEQQDGEEECRVDQCRGDRGEQRELLGQRVGRALLDNRECSMAEQADRRGAKPLLHGRQDAHQTFVELGILVHAEGDAAGGEHHEARQIEANERGDRAGQARLQPTERCRQLGRRRSRKALGQREEARLRGEKGAWSRSGRHSGGRLALPRGQKLVQRAFVQMILPISTRAIPARRSA